MELVVPAVGAAIGFVIGGPQGAAIGWSIGSAISAQGESQEGPRVKDLGYSGSSFGIPVPRVWGTCAVSGSYIWAPDLFEVENSEGGKGPQVTTYKYYGSFAAMLCEGPVAGVRRIWLDTDLVYDASDGNEGNVLVKSLGTVQITEAGGWDLGEGITAYVEGPGRVNVHLGASTQGPDSIIEETEGTGNVSAHRGYCYVVFDRIPVENYGNKLPTSIRAEIVKDDSYANARVDTGVTGTNIIYSSADNSVITVVHNIATSTHTFTKWNTNTNSIVGISPDIPSGASPSFNTFDIDPITGTIYTWRWYPDGSHSQIVSIDSNGWAMKQGKHYLSGSVCSEGDEEYENPAEYMHFFAPSKIVKLKNYIAVCGGTTGTDGLRLWPSLNSCQFAYYNTTDAVSDVSDDSDGNIWWIESAGDKLTIRDDTSINVNTELGINSPNRIQWHVPTQSMLISTTGTNIYRVSYDRTASPQFVVEASATGAILFSDSSNAWLFTENLWLDEGNGTDYRQVLISDLSTIRTVAPGGIVGDHVYDPLSNAIWHTNSSQVRKYNLDRIPDGGQPLSTVVGDIASDLDARIDVSGLNQTVRGFLMTRPEENREAIRRLMVSHKFDGVEADGEVKFIELDGGLAATIPESDLAAHQYGAETPPQTEITRTQEIVFPKRTEVIALSRELEYETTSQGAGRIISKSTGSIKVELLEVFTDDQAAQLAEVLLRVPRTERNVHNLPLPMKYLHLHPIDNIQITKGSTTHRVRLTESDWSGLLTSNTAISTEAAVYTSTATGAGSDGFIPTVIRPTPVSIPYMLDLPLLTEFEDPNAAGFYVGYDSYGTFKGATLYRGDTATSSAITEMGIGTVDAVAGFTTSTLADVTDTTVWDTTNTITVRLVSGSLSSSTDDAVIAGANALGFVESGEIVQFVNASLDSPDTGEYTLSRLLRARRCTEWATGSHITGESFVLLTKPTIYNIATSITTSGIQFYYRAIGFGLSFSEAIPKAFTNNNVRLKPCSGVNPAVSYSGDVTITWTRRTRLFIEPGYGSVPMGEESESYEIDILDENGTVVRTLTSTTPSVAYTAAQMIEDFTSQVSGFDVNIYQMSATVGRGWPLSFSTYDVSNYFPIYTDFSEYALASDPTTVNWAVEWSAGTPTFSIVGGSPASGNLFSVQQTATNTTVILSYTNAGTAADCQILVKGKYNTGDLLGNGVFVRGRATGGDYEAYTVTIGGTKFLRLFFSDVGGGTDVDLSGSPMLATGLTQGDDYWMRLDVRGSTLRVQFSLTNIDATTPVWDITTTDTNLIDAGQIGIISSDDSNPFLYDQIAVAYNGDNATFS